MITLLDLLIVAAIIGFAVWGWREGLLAAAVAALELVACLSIAVMLHETIAWFLDERVVWLLGDWLRPWLIPLAFGLTAWGSFAIVRLRLHRRAPDAEADEAEIDPLGDRLGGAVAGGIGGAIFTGAVLVTISMVPFLAGLKPSGDRLLVDVGKLALRTAGRFDLERHEGRSLPLEGEPPSRSSDRSARLTSEPWFDADDDGNFTEADRFRDVDDNDTFTKSLYYSDVDGQGSRRIGLIDKYVAGCWDDRLISNETRRQDDAAQPAQPGMGGQPSAPPKPPKPPAGKTEPGSGKTADGKTSDGTQGDGKTADGKTADGKTSDGTQGDGKQSDDDF